MNLQAQKFCVITHLKNISWDNDPFFFLRDFKVNELIEVYGKQELKAIAKSLKQRFKQLKLPSFNYSKLNEKELAIIINDKFLILESKNHEKEK